MKSVLPVVIFLIFSGGANATEDIEKEFLERLIVFIQEGDFSREKLKTVWLYQDTPDYAITGVVEGLQQLKERGIKEYRFCAVPDDKLKEFSARLEYEGKLYSQNLELYKILELYFQDEIILDGEIEKGKSLTLGKLQGKLYMIGFKKQNQVQVATP